ncbi:hypothetical protein IQ13_2195 [Lacibacter cauensis]|uniref:Uncharacterized protein n=1 Tax=Lacibacter cauensis TaxID=510947 RepID=A0A562SIR5_9BACT|nr:hypothetical protein [Lacibacter cauensis]TWI81179.1 hypothetical protein IQ13_2195 [Lacibacter cauensis]
MPNQSFQETQSNPLYSWGYLVLAALILALLNNLIFYFWDAFASDVFNWFNSLKLIWKLLLLLLGGLAFFSFILNLIKSIILLVISIVFRKVPVNPVTYIGSSILAFINSAFLTYIIWTTPERYNLWIIIELLVMTGFVFGISNCVVPQRLFKKDEDTN